MRQFVTIGLLLMCLTGGAQQDILFSQYMFNPFVVNPAYTGTREALSMVGGVRSQWMGIDGAPRSTTLTLHGPFGRRVGLGLQVFAEEIGPKGSISYAGAYSYRLPLGSGKLSMGLRLGGVTYQFKWQEIDYKDQDDVFNYGQETSVTAFNADFGIYYYTKKFFIGASANHLANTLRIDEFTNNGSEEYLRGHLFLLTGYTIEVSDGLALQPSLLVRQVSGAPVNADINFNMLFAKRFWLGASFRSANAVALLAQLYFTPKFRLGYAYDMGINRIGRLGRGSHEIFMAIDLNTGKYKVDSPRYF